MSIADLGYRTFDGEIKGRAYRIKTLAWNQFRSFWQSTLSSFWIKIIMIIFWLPIVIFVGIFALVPFDLMMFGEQGSAAIEELLLAMITILVLMVTLIVSWIFFTFIGSGAIADDEQNRTLELYFTRSMRRSDYILGKGLALLIAAFLMEIPPITILFTSFAIRAPASLSIHGFGILPLYVGTIGFILLANTFYIVMILAFSASTKSRRYAGFSFFLVMTFSEAIAQLLVNFGGSRFEILSITGNLTSILNAVMDPSGGILNAFGPQSVGGSLLTNFAIMGGLILLFSAILTYQVLTKTI